MLKSKFVCKMFLVFMVPTDHDIPFSRTFQGLLRYIFKEFSRTFLCSFKTFIREKMINNGLFKRDKQRPFDLEFARNMGGGWGLVMCF